MSFTVATKHTISRVLQFIQFASTQHPDYASVLSRATLLAFRDIWYAENPCGRFSRSHSRASRRTHTHSGGILNGRKARNQIDIPTYTQFCEWGSCGILVGVGVYKDIHEHNSHTLPYTYNRWLCGASSHHIHAQHTVSHSHLDRETRNAAE